VKIIVGLGNPGPQYARTRHNLGFNVLDALAARLGTALDREKHQGLVAEARIGGDKVMLVKPLTYMNRSGDCVARLARNNVFDPSDILIAVDDINLPLGRLRFRAGGSAGGHNGLKSLIERLGSRDFHRMRMGVGDERQGPDLAGHVLSKFRPDEREAAEELVDRAAAAAVAWAESGIDHVQREYNG